MLDVGSGLGHWGQTLLQVLPPTATVVGIDREPVWVQKATKRAHALGLESRCEYRVGSAENIPFKSSTFDMVTCQTLLMHVQDVAKVFDELLRVLKPGGLLAVVEPNNRVGMLISNTMTASWPVERLLERVRFYLICEQGKMAMAQGFNSIGDLLLRHFLTRKLDDVQIYISDKCFPIGDGLYGAEQDVMRSSLLQMANQEMWIWPRAEAEQYFLAGGGTRTEFTHEWGRRLEELRAEAEALQRNELADNGAGITYLVSGRKPR